MQLYGEDAEKSDEIARVISGIYHNIEETTADEAGKRLLVKPLINTFKIAFTKLRTSAPDLKVSNLD